MIALILKNPSASQSDLTSVWTKNKMFPKTFVKKGLGSVR